MKTTSNSLLFFTLILLIACTPGPPSPVHPTPTEDQLRWQEMEFYGFLHFNMNTFTNIEWGYGDKKPETFNPTELDARQWARVAKEAGMTGLIITAKHHDGFCLWPSEYTEHSVKNSPWRDGKGDVIRELADACKEYGLKLGVYLSPWDRNHADYGKPEYITYFRNQLTELLTNYGDIFEVWFDGANGGDGYYGGANESRKVDKLSYYGWEETYKLVKELQPNAIIFSDAGPGTRWVGNEHGHAYETTWSPLLKDSVYGGMPEYSKKYSMGQENGTHWVPAEADVSIRPGWYYHPYEDDKVHSLKKLLDIYYYSIGRNSTFLLNFPVDTRGLIHENDVAQLQKLTNQLNLDFANNLALNAKIETSNTRSDAAFSARAAVDGEKHTYWATEDGVIESSLTIDFEQPTTFNRFVVQEYIALGQRVKKFKLDAEVDGKWETIDNQTTVGYKRILRFDDVTATKLKLTIEDAKASPTISNIEVYNAPLVVDAPKIIRDKNGIVSLNVPEDGVDIYYTLNGETPTTESSKYSKAFEVHKPTIIKTFALDSKTNRKSEINSKSFDISKNKWSIVGGDKKLEASIDDNPNSNAQIDDELIIDLGASQRIKGFTYLPSQSKWSKNEITHYSFYGSSNGKKWRLLKKGEFSNIIANPIEQKISFDKKSRVKFVKLTANKVKNKDQKALVAEIGIITK